ncbi:3-hydroxyacyl-CoA dehydrogenase NAD-binding domain-containing protein [Pseudoroseicyclus aestuarii]|uniref:Carnitine 3-dehydrogenase n=1 Tax=Pseudoroseicyclus aestuarii TaxID=1795041 RepID=A0A318SWJ6_9RHOB|nr:3-hydroxyacyl-CoA dehydrogenase NAD-binding domain-containing protein [Pseudoroseicyclus aestuarii]PYE85882.1 carnitine 3-dehydrogenase [Pseudoroseicyclus aestuarii]
MSAPAQGQRIAAILGAGRTGAGWAARFALMGWDVRMHDPDMRAAPHFEAVLARARRSLPGLLDVAPPVEGTVSWHAGIADAVRGASWIQESVPERLDLKQSVLAELDDHAEPEAIIASSSAGIDLAQLQGDLPRRGRMVIARPLAPVYLVPLVELVASAASRDEVVEQARSTLLSLGCYPLRMGREEHLMGRLSAALWQEAAQLVADGAADAETVDDALRHGAALLWTQTGLFGTGPIAGEDLRVEVEEPVQTESDPLSGMPRAPRRAQPLHDVIDRLEARAGGLPDGRDAPQEVRDAALSSLLRGLKGADWGAGRLLRGMDRRYDDTPDLEALALTSPLPTASRTIPVDWVGQDGCVAEWRVAELMDGATWRLLRMVGCDEAEGDHQGGGGPSDRGETFLMAETHLRHLGVARAGDAVTVETQVLSFQGRHLQLFHKLWLDKRLVASAEVLLVHADRRERRPTVPAADLAARLSALAAAHQRLPRPEGSGRVAMRPEPEV